MALSLVYVSILVEGGILIEGGSLCGLFTVLYLSGSIVAQKHNEKYTPTALVIFETKDFPQSPNYNVTKASGPITTSANMISNK